MTKTYTRYALLDENGEPAMHCHQDDMEDPIVADNLDTLITIAGDWADMGANSFLEMFNDPGSDYGEYTIVREDVTVSELNDKDKATLKQIAEDDPPYRPHDVVVAESIVAQLNDNDKASVPTLGGIPSKLAYCIATGLHLTSCDDDGFCNHCGHQESTEDEAD